MRTKVAAQKLTGGKSPRRILSSMAVGRRPVIAAEEAAALHLRGIKDHISSLLKKVTDLQTKVTALQTTLTLWNDLTCDTDSFEDHSVIDLTSDTEDEQEPEIKPQDIFSSSEKSPSL
jgi:hypothetical protein